MSDPVPAKPAASLVLVRDAPGGLEVLMQTRAAHLAFAGGLLVFPGGRVDPADGAGLRGFRRAAVRELFEETGLLLARRLGNRCMVEEARRQRLARRYRDRLRFDVLAWDSLLRREGLREGARQGMRDLVPFAHWITPEVVPKRFDTRFFLARAPRRQRASPDGDETVALHWMRPGDLLAAWEREGAALMFPTRLILTKLSQAATVAQAYSLARGSVEATILPRVEMRNGRRRVTIPAEAGYGVTEASHLDADMRMG